MFSWLEVAIIDQFTSNINIRFCYILDKSAVQQNSLSFPQKVWGFGVQAVLNDRIPLFLLHRYIKYLQ